MPIREKTSLQHTDQLASFGSLQRLQALIDVWTRVFQRASPLEWLDSLFVVLLENHSKKRFGVATYFCFILKGENKIRKKNPKCDS